MVKCDGKCSSLLLEIVKRWQSISEDEVEAGTLVAGCALKETVTVKGVNHPPFTL